ncbi:MAG: hypothetical protein KDB14_20360 [Planctomycetales bacterium]|nr:hypothetical protein [Planctomycetales bacterium]
MRRTLKAGLFGLLSLVMAELAGAQAPNPLPPPPTPVIARSASAGVTIADVVAMHQSGLGDTVIIESIRQNKMAGTLNVNELISMRQHGISNEVIQAMQQYAPLPAPRPTMQASATVQAAPTVVAAPPVVVPTIVQPVARPVIVAPVPVYHPYYRPYYHHHHHHVPYRSSSVGLHIRF